jgi:hypothetical protein
VVAALAPMRGRSRGASWAALGEEWAAAWVARARRRGRRQARTMRVALQAGAASDARHHSARARPVCPGFPRWGPGPSPLAGARRIRRDRGRHATRQAARRPGGTWLRFLLRQESRRRRVRAPRAGNLPGRKEVPAEYFVVRALEVASRRGPFAVILDREHPAFSRRVFSTVV